MIIGIYCRFSKETDNTQSQLSLQNQKDNGIKFCERNGYDYIIYSERISGNKELNERDEGKKLLEDIDDKKIDGVWVDKDDRLYRNFEESILFKLKLNKNKIKYYVSDKEERFDNPMDKLIGLITSYKSEEERNDIMRRMKRGKRDRLRMGLPLGRQPYGYLVEIINGKKQWIINESVKDKIIGCYKSYVNKDFKTLREWSLYCRGKFNFDKSIQWFKDLRKKHYNGEYIVNFKSEEYVIQIPKIIDDKLYNQFIEKINIQLKENKGNNVRKGYINILKGKGYCGVCKNKLNIGGLTKKGKGYIRYLRCVFGGEKFKRLYVGKKRHIKNHSSSIEYDLIKDIVYRIVCEVITKSYTIKEEFRKNYYTNIDIDNSNNEIQKWEKELDKLKRKERVLEENLIEGLINKDNVIKHKKNIELERLRIEGFIHSINDEIQKFEERNKLLKWRDEFNKEYNINNLLSKSEEEKQTLISKYINKFWFSGLKDDYQLKVEFNIPIVNDKLIFDKEKYHSFIKDGGDKKEFKKSFYVKEGDILVSKTIGMV